MTVHRPFAPLKACGLDCEDWVRARVDLADASDAQLGALMRLQRAQRLPDSTAVWCRSLGEAGPGFRLSSQGCEPGAYLEEPRVCFDGPVSPTRGVGVHLVNARRSPLPLCRLRCELLLAVEQPPAASRPGPYEAGWCRVDSKEVLLRRIEEAASSSRLMLVAAAYQAYYYERMFMEWAIEYPRLMFVTVKLPETCRPEPIFGDPDLTKQLFGHAAVSGCHFVSLANGIASSRPFSGESRSGAEVRAALLTRVTASARAGHVQEFAEGAVRLSLEVASGSALCKLLARLGRPPNSARLEMHVRCTGGPSTPTFGARDYAPLVCSDRFPRSRLHKKVRDPEMPETLLAGAASKLGGLRTAPRQEQWRSVSWMLKREAVAAEVLGEEHSSAELGPYEVSWQLRFGLWLRGGILGDAIGFGKTLCSLLLVYLSGMSLQEMREKEPGASVHPAAASSWRPSRATLVVMPPHLLREWTREVNKHFQPASLCVVVVEGLHDLQTTSVEALQNADLVLVSFRLWDSLHYRRNVLLMRGDWDGYAGAVRALREVPSLAGLPGKALEIFRWRRLVVDEAHEIYSAEGDTWALPVSMLEASARWCLTGTPPGVAEDLHGASRLLGAHLGPAVSLPLAEAFWRQCVRQTMLSANCIDVPEPRERVVDVHLRPQERVLYQQANHERADRIRRRDMQAYEQLLQLCSHYVLRRQEVEGAASAQDEVARELERRERELDRAQRGLQEAAAAVSAVDAALRNDAVEDTLNLAQLSERRRNLEGRREERLDQRRLAEARARKAEASLAFLQRTLRIVAEGQERLSCPVCLRSYSRSSDAHGGHATDELFADAALTPCGHIFCASCVQQVSRDHGICATCRAPVAAGDWTRLGDTQLGACCSKFCAEEPETDRQTSRFGAKIVAVVGTLRQIRTAEPNAKCLIYCQWDALKLKMLEAFRELGLRALSLQGSPAEMRRTLERFQEPNACDNFALFLSLQRKAAGMNLQCATHVLFVHPFWACEGEHAVQWEAQAIGRAHRPGQTRQVTVHRFIAMNTLEHDILVQRQLGSWKKYVQRRASLVDLEDTGAEAGPPGERRVAVASATAADSAGAAAAEAET